MTVKSGPATINDTQVTGMKDAIKVHHLDWLQSSVDAYEVDGIDIVIGLTYGTERSTNNKENQILAKLLDSGFDEVDRESRPGILQNTDGSVRIYRVVGLGFWSFVGNPADPETAEHVALEVLLALAKALSEGEAAKDIDEALSTRIAMLSAAIAALESPREYFPNGSGKSSVKRN